MTIVDWKKPWAAETNYASGPYAGTATKIAPVGDVETPNTKPPAQNFNYTLNDIETRLTRYAISAAIGNWPGATQTVVAPGPTNVTLHSACWNYQLQRWTGMFFAGAALYAMDTHDSGQTWQSLNPSNVSSGGGCLASASNGTFDFFCSQLNSTTTQIIAVTFNGSQTTTTQSFLNSLKCATMFNIPGFGVLLFGSEQSGGTMTGHLAAGNTSGAWTDNSTALPSLWQSDTNHVAMYVNANDGTFTVAANNYIVGMCGASTSDHSRLLKFSTLGGGLTDITPAILSGKVLSGLCYSDVDALWGLTCWDGTATYLYTSPDLSTWTLVHSWSAASAGFGGSPGGSVAAIGGVWAVQLVILDGGSGTTDNDRLMLSADVGTLGASAQWTTASYCLIDDTTSGIYPTPQLRSNNHQLLAWNNGAHMFSRQVGFTPQGLY